VELFAQTATSSGKGDDLKQKETRRKVRTMMLVALVISIPVLMGIGQCFNPRTMG
jgi:hypothetical protein